MRKIVLLPAPMLACIIATSPHLFAIDALSPVERYIGNDYNSEEYSDLDLNEQNRFAPASPADSDLGDQLILKRYDNRDPLRVDLSTQLFWTNNTASTSTAKDDGTIWRTRLATSWKPRISNNLFADVAASYNVYRYDSSPTFDLDFERSDFRLGLVKIAPDFFDLLFFARYEFSSTRANTTVGVAASTQKINYDAHRIRVGAHKVFLSTPKHTAYVALDAAYDLSASPSRLERNEYSAHLGYSYQITDKLRAVLYYHLAYYDYDLGGREDYNHVLGAELYWQLSQSTRIHTSFTYVKNDSNLPFGGADYDSIQGGLGIGFTTRF